MSLRKFPNFLEAYMRYTIHSEAPDTYHFWTGVSTVAGALQRKVWIDCNYWDWVPNFYIIFVAPPGIVSKSTTAGIGMNLLRKVVPKIKFGPDSATWQMLVQEMANGTSIFTTPEGKFQKQSAITVVASELGTFLKPQDNEMIDALVSLWDGQRGEWRKATKTQGNDSIINPWINLIGCTTPAWITSAFPEYMVGGGFTSRCIFIYADKKRRLVAYPAKETLITDKALEGDLIHDLCEIAKMVGEVRLTPDAYELGEKWYHQFHTNPPKELANDQFAGYIARKQTHIHKLAIVLSAAESNELYIEAKHLEAAIAIVTSLEADMPNVFNKIGQDTQSRKASILRDLIASAGEIQQDELFRRCIRTMSIMEFKAGLDGALLAKFCVKVQRGTTMWIKINSQTPPEVNTPVQSPSQ